MPDGTLYQLADAVSVDRTGREFRGQVPPDEPLPIDWGKLGQDDDPVVNVALAWLEQMK